MNTPKRNEAADFYERLYGMKFILFLDPNSESEDGNVVELRLAATVGERALFETVDHAILHTASEYSALQGEVSRLREDAMRYRELKRGRRQPFGDDFVVRKFNRTFGEEEPVEWSEVERELDNRINLEPPTDGR